MMTSFHVIPETIGQAVHMVSAKLAECGIESHRLDARLLVANGAGVMPENILISPKHVLDGECQRKISNFLSRRISREPIPYILGQREFWSKEFHVTSDTLIPRPDTETLVEVVLEVYGKYRDISCPLILDLGTGSGCILLSLLSEMSFAHGVGLDSSVEALSIARQNAERHRLVTRAHFVKGNWLENLKGEFDIIVSNPPYITTRDISKLEPEVAEHEPKIALDGGDDGLDAYRSICTKITHHLKPGGLIAFEIDSIKVAAVKKLMKEQGLINLQIRHDLAGIERVVFATRSE